jgi:hypothetical protein
MIGLGVIGWDSEYEGRLNGKIGKKEGQRSALDPLGP